MHQAEDLRDKIHNEFLTDGLMVELGRQLGHRLNKELRDDPNGNGARQGNWQSNEDISALDGMATDDNGRPVKA